MSIAESIEEIIKETEEEESIADVMLSEPEEPEAPERVREEAITITPLPEEDISLSDWGFIGFGAAGIGIIVSLGIAAIFKILWRSAS